MINTACLKPKINPVFMNGRQGAGTGWKKVKGLAKNIYAQPTDTANCTVIATGKVGSGDWVGWANGGKWGHL